MDTLPRTFYLPDTMMDNWPWPRVLNPHYEAMKLEVEAWRRDFKALGPEAHEAFEKCDIVLLMALACPKASKDHLRIASEFMAICLVVDEYTDVEDGEFAKETVDVIIDALNNPHKIRPEGECVLGEMAQQFWARAIQTTSLSFQRHFIDSFTAYLRGVIEEALDRDRGHHRSIDDHFKHRRNTSGSFACMAISEIGMDLPDEVAYHPAIRELKECIANLIFIENDIFSYNVEQATGIDNNNLIPALMVELGLDISGAMAWAARYHVEVQKKFLDGLTIVPSWGPSIDVLVKEYIDGIATWARATYCWSIEIQRYFGTRGPEIQQTRLISLLPKVNCTVATSDERYGKCHKVAD